MLIRLTLAACVLRAVCADHSCTYLGGLVGGFLDDWEGGWVGGWDINHIHWIGFAYNESWLSGSNIIHN